MSSTEITAIPDKLAEKIARRAVACFMPPDYEIDFRAWVKVLIKETLKDNTYVDRI